METFDASSAITHSSNAIVTDELVGMCTAPASVQVYNFETATSLEVASALGEALDEVIADGKAALLHLDQTPRKKTANRVKTRSTWASIITWPQRQKPIHKSIQ